MVDYKTLYEELLVKYDALLVDSIIKTADSVGDKHDKGNATYKANTDNLSRPFLIKRLNGTVLLLKKAKADNEVLASSNKLLKEQLFVLKRELSKYDDSYK